jgi:hypothetical protein
VDSVERAGVRPRVVSMPCRKRLGEEVETCREQILPREATALLVIGAATLLHWDRHGGPRGAVVRIEHLGAPQRCDAGVWFCTNGTAEAGAGATGLSAWLAGGRFSGSPGDGTRASLDDRPNGRMRQ